MTVAHGREIIVAALLCWLAPASFTLGADKITDDGVAVLQRWVDAVNGHSPGRPDHGVASVAAMTYANRVAMNSCIGLLEAVLTERPVVTRGREDERVAAIARALQRNPGAPTFLKRAAMLHADAVIFAERFPQPEDKTLPPPSPGGVRPAARDSEFTSVRTPLSDVPPLLTNTQVVMHQDGEILGGARANWNWVFARSLLDLLLPPPHNREALDPFVGDWYHAASAYMLANAFYGDATGHLHRAGVVLPQDPRILFDRASYAEILGLPAHQVLLEDWRPGQLNARVPSAETTNKEAERLFRETLASDPSFVEARVRLGRLLDARGAHAEAAAELRAALAQNPPREVAFYGHLFAARAAQSLGHNEDAAAHYEAASTLYPDAQSARLGASQLALLKADVAGTLASVERLGPASAREAADPWWTYALASGRDVNELMERLWTAVRR